MKYIITSSSFSGEILLEYGETGHLIAYKYAAQMTAVQFAFWIKYFPIDKENLEGMKSLSKTMTVTEVKTDLSFDAFWATYNYKVGNKKRAEKLWNTMSEAEQLQVFKNMPEYDKYLLSKPSMEKLYAETYLNQRRFETDYKKLIRK